ncbi:MAG: hypothetical protein ACTSXD_13415 [Candidatus Heimdallarchaeaceae archaeon]
MKIEFYPSDTGYIHYNKIFKFPYLLVSYYYRNELKKIKNIVKNFKVFGDSGGFQMITKSDYLNPLNVLRWQEENCYKGAILDYPYVTKIPTTKKLDFSYCLLKTVESCEIYKQNRIGSCKIFNVLQGEKPKEIDLWFNQISKFTFDGWAIPYRKYDGLEFFLYKFYRIYEHTNNNMFHILMATGNNIIPIIIYIAKILDLELSFDSSSHTFFSRLRRYNLFFDGIDIKTKTKNEGFKIFPLPCHCPACRIINEKFTEEQFFNCINDNISCEIANLGNLHNLINFVDKINMLTKLVKRDEENYKEFCTTYFNKNLQKHFDLIDSLVDNPSYNKILTISHKSLLNY